ncbi:MAG: hypothetical protein ACXVBZ_08080 [Flavisolibacter sp.]
MELDDLKQAWNQQNKQSSQNQDIMELIHQKSKGPVASLKQAFMKQTRFFIFLMVAMIATQISNLDNTAALIFICTYILFCIGVAFFFYQNYRITSELDGMDGNVRSSLERYVTVLQQRLKWQRIGARIVLLIFVLLLEIVPFYFHGRMLDKWHSLPPAIRFNIYAAFLVIQYFVGRSLENRKFGQYLTYLKELTTELK